MNLSKNKERQSCASAESDAHGGQQPRSLMLSALPPLLSVFPHCYLFSAFFSLSPLCLTAKNRISIQRNASFITKNRFCVAPFCCVRYLHVLALSIQMYTFSALAMVYVCLDIVCPIRKLFCQRTKTSERLCVFFGKNMNAHLSLRFFPTWRFVVGYLCVYQYSCLSVCVRSFSTCTRDMHKKCDRPTDRPTAIVWIWTLAITMCT